MPKHTRSTSHTHGANYNSSSMSASLAPSPIYTQHPRMTMANTGYYNVPTTSASSMAIQAQAQVQAASAYDSYAAAAPSSATAVSMPSLPPQHRASSGAWTPQDDQQLLNARMQGLNWGQIQANCFPNKTPNACRKRHERLMERKGAHDWDNQKMQYLAKEYMSMRKEIWGPLAARTGEKWSVVEQKCMSHGLKNLQSAARAATRRDRLEAGSGPYSGYDDDSGISGMGLTPVDDLDAPYSSPATTASSTHSGPVAAAAATYHQLQQSQAHLAASLGPAPGAGPYGMAYGGDANGYASHGYSSSVSSNASVYGHPGSGHSAGNSPYMPTQRPGSADMGIGAIINRPGRHGV